MPKEHAPLIETREAEQGQGAANGSEYESTQIKARAFVSVESPQGQGCSGIGHSRRAELRDGKADVSREAPLPGTRTIMPLLAHAVYSQGRRAPHRRTAVGSSRR
jgi:hypothetical protein